jgi:hypothetical protein
VVKVWGERGSENRWDIIYKHLMQVNIKFDYSKNILAML